jgi:YjbE family integral membrane protein
MGTLVALSSLADRFSEQVLTLFGGYGLTVLAALKIIGVNIILSGDNAVVIALACRSLPPRQRMAGILLGAGAAIVLRIFFTLVVQQLLDLALLRLGGGLLLFWIAVKLLMSEEANEDSVASGGNLWEAVKIVALADIVMSLDNVLAIAAAAGGDPYLIVFGLVVSIPLVIGGSTLIMGLLTRFPILVWAGAALLGWIAGELIATEPVLQPALASVAEFLGVATKLLTRGLEVVGAFLVVLVGWVIMRVSSRRMGHA